MDIKEKCSVIRSALQSILDDKDATDDDKGRAKEALAALGDDKDDDAATKAKGPPGYSNLGEYLDQKMGIDRPSATATTREDGGMSTVFRPMSPEQARARLAEIEGRSR
jgi:hypothetical protein